MLTETVAAEEAPAAQPHYIVDVKRELAQERDALIELELRRPRHQVVGTVEKTGRFGFDFRDVSGKQWWWRYGDVVAFSDPQTHQRLAVVQRSWAGQHPGKIAAIVTGIAVASAIGWLLALMPYT